MILPGRRWAALKGFSLVEVLVATGILAAIGIPLIGLMSSTKTDLQSEEGMVEAVTFAQNVMEQLISEKVPFSAVDPAGGSRFVKGGPGGSFNQAGFRDVTIKGTAFKAADLEKILSDSEETLADGLYRTKRVKNKPYYLCLFVGKYPWRDRIPDPREPGQKLKDIDQSLTFVFLDNPAPPGLPFRLAPASANINKQVILDGATVTASGASLAAIPYKLESFQSGTVAGTARTLSVPGDTPYFYQDPTRGGVILSGYTLIPGWPRVTGNPSFKNDLFDKDSDQRAVWQSHLREVYKGEGGKKPTVAYHPLVFDQRDVGEPDGTLMKVVLGVKFDPYVHSKDRGGKATSQSMREFWLVSLKALVVDD